MSTIQWTIELVTIFCIAMIAMAVISYLVAALRHSRRNTELNAQLEQIQQQLSKSAEQLTDFREKNEQLQDKNHQLELSEGKLEQQLTATQEKSQTLEERLTEAQNEAKSERNSLRQQLDTLNQQHHEAEKQRDTAQAEIRSLNKQQNELRDRLQQADIQLQDERNEIGRLQDALAQEGKKAKALEASEKETREQLREVKAQLVAAIEKQDELQARITDLNAQYTKLKTEQDEREASHAREVANFEQQKASLSEQFKLLSNEILEAKTKSLQENSKLTLSSIMNPFQQSIDDFKKEVKDIHHRETTQQGELRKELESLKELNRKITAEAHELSTALRGQKKLQGNWGELVLENVLDRSGLQLGKDYQREVSITTEEGRQRPDAVVYLPQEKHLIIDAKVSLNAYTRFVNAEDETERTHALKDHVHAVISRIKELADRDYYKLPGLNSPEMVFMFIPIESAFVEALKADETIFQSAIENNVLVATPTTLLTSLNIVRQLWRYEDQNKHTAALANKAEAVFKKLNSFLASFEKIKKGLDSATSAYTTAENQLVSGRGNLVKQVGEFKNLAPAIKAELPKYFVEKAALEIDYIPVEADGEGEVKTADQAEENIAEVLTEKK